MFGRIRIKDSYSNNIIIISTDEDDGAIQRGKPSQMPKFTLQNEYSLAHFMLS